jgi:DhnA family fructose-bisphosphate aldolase class Ia
MRTIGKEIRLGRLFGHEKNLIITAVDHGTEMGTIPGLVKLPKTLESVTASDAILVNAETIADYKQAFARPGAPALLARTTWTTAYCFLWGYDEGHSTIVMTPEEALALGANAAVASCVLQTGSQEADRNNIQVFSKLVRASNSCGLPLVGEAYPLGADDMPQAQLHKQIGDSCRILYELGADAIKTFYTGPDFQEIVESVEVPILVLGAVKKKTDLAALEMAENAMKAGGRGVVFGRNVFQAKDPGKFIEALKEIAAHKSGAKEAAAKYGLE